MSRDFNSFVRPIDYQYRRRPAEERAIEDNFKNQTEAFDLLALIDAEFQSDPTSTQCFDLRIVERVRISVAKRKKYEQFGSAMQK